MSSSDGEPEYDLKKVDLGGDYRLGEGLFYDVDTERIWGVDITGGKIFCFVPGLSKMVEWRTRIPYPSCIIPIEDNEQELVVTGGNKIYLWEPGSNTEKVIYELETPDSKLTRFNDGKCDPMGRFWIGTTDVHDRPNRAALYKMVRKADNQKESGWTLEKKLDASLSNGLGWNTAGNQFYYVDTLTKTLQVFAYDLKIGELVDRLRVIELCKFAGIPDGLTVDTRDRVWIAMWNGSQVIGFNPNYDENLVDKLTIEQPKPTTSIITPKGDMYVSTSRGKLYHKYFDSIQN